MNTKVIVAVVAAVAIIGAGVAVILLANHGPEAKYSDKAYEIVSRVNTEGSGLYIDDGVLSARGGVDKFFDIDGEKYTLNKDKANAWAGLIFGTPNTNSIQHIQMGQIASELGLKFLIYTDGADTSVASGNIYYVTNVFNADTAITKLGSHEINAGILWQPQYEKIVETAGYSELALTNNVFEGHTCCIIAASHKYLENNAEVMERFLAAYIKGVNHVNEALKNPVYASNPAYKAIVDKAVDYTGLSQEVVENSLKTIGYTYADDMGENANLSQLTDDVEQLIKDLYNIKAVDSDSNAGVIAGALVNDKYVKEAVKMTPGTYESKTTIKVAVITGDIHQIVLHVADSLGYFDEYGIDLDINGSSAGGPVAIALQNGSADVGFLGAPPATIATINQSLITV